MVPRLSPLLGCLMVLVTTAHFARAQEIQRVQEGDVWMKAAELGSAAVTGKDASDTFKARAARLHLAMGCGNEFAFARGFALASRHGKEGYAPPRKPGEQSKEGLAQWPVTLMLGKAARLIDQSRNGAPCETTLEGDEGAIFTDWLGLTGDGLKEPKPKLEDKSAADVINRVYRELYDEVDGAGGAPCASVAQMREGKVSLSLSDECLARQIRAVMTDPRHGPWTDKGAKRTPQLPGTSASELPCLSEFTIGVEGIEGDWDMAVIEHTRLASLLYRFDPLTLAIRADVDAALAALNRRFLTLRSSPEQGATAREIFNLVTSCGNSPNQFGDAIDTVNGSGADPGFDSYSDAAQDAVGETSFWEDLWRFFLAVLVVAAIALGAALAGAIVGAIVGALAGGAVAVAVAVAVVVGAVVLITFAGGGIEETENHLLMQNTSRYLKNKLMMAELSAQDNRKAFDTIADLNEDVRSWLLKRLQRIARDDFVEYNSKPYNRLSHASIVNLFDYACDVSWDYKFSPIIVNSDRACDDKDRAVVTAAAAVLDLSAAKLAVGSMQGRRLIPYRRLAEENHRYYTGRSILELTSGADGQLAALQIWTGQMRHAPGGVAWPGTFGDLAWYSTSQYRPDPIILDMAVNKTVAREQQYRHHTRERYASGNGWLITAGGSDEGPGQGFRSPLGFTLYFPVANDRGVGVPTTLMTGAQIAGKNGKPEGRARMKEFLRFEGNEEYRWDGSTPLLSFSDNNCVAGSFACGHALRLPSDFDAATCRTHSIEGDFFIVDSTKCAAFHDGDSSAENDIFIAFFQNRTTDWGFIEIAQQDAYGRSAVAFANAIKANNKDRIAGWRTAPSSDTIEYFAVTQNRLLKFTPKDEDFSADRRACGVVNHESGARFTISNVPAVQAGACRSVGPRIFIDLNDAMNPIRHGEGGLALEQFGR